MRQIATVTVVVPVFDRPREIQSFVRQMLAQTHTHFTLVIVDHGTKPADLSAFDDTRIRILRESSELWWTGAMNRGIEWALAETPPSDYILVINDDTRFEPTYLQSLVELGSLYPKAIIGSLSLEERTGRILSGSFSLSKLRARFVPRYYRRRMEEVPETPLPTDILPGRGMLVPRDTFERIGLFLETALPHYGADNEFSYRARKAGYDLYVSRQCVVRTNGAAPLASTNGRWGLASQHLFGPKSKGNLPALLNLSRHCFRSPYSYYFFAVNTIRKALSTVKHCHR